MGLLLLILMVIVLTAASFLFNNLQEEYNNRLSIATAETVSKAIGRVSFSGKYHTRKLVSELIAEVKELAYISVEDLNHKVFAHSNPAMNDTIVSKEAQTENYDCLKKNIPCIFEKQTNGLIVNEVIIPYRGGIDDEVLGLVRVGIDFTDLRTSQANNFKKMLTLIGFLTLASIFLAYLLSRHFGRSIRDLASRLQGILDYAPIGLIISHSDGNIELSSKETQAFFPAAAEARTIEEQHDSLQNAALAKKLNDLEKQAFSTSGFVEAEIEIVKETGNKAFWQISKFPIARNKKGINSLICSFLRDTTEKHAAEIKLKENAETFRRLFDNSSDAILLLKDGRFVECNRATLNLTGLSDKEQLVGRCLADISPEHQPDGNSSSKLLESKFRQATEDGYSRFEYALKKPDTSTFWVDMAITPISIGGTQMLHMTWRDISEYKKAEQEKEKLQEQLLQSQKMDAIGQLAGGVAHDFNNILSGIMGATELLKNLETEQKKSQFLEMILSSTRRAADLTKKLLTFAKKKQKDSTPVDLARVIANSIDIFRQTFNKNITLKFENKAETTIVLGDETLLQNVFMNLGINSSHAMPEGGIIDFSIRNVVLSSEYCQASPFDLTPGAFVEVEVRDTGCGMPIEVQKRIFEPFFSTKERGKGTGLGLAMAYGAIKGQGGAINVYSEPGVGTVFHIYLPVASRGQNVLHEEQPVIMGSGRILFVEDEDFLRVLGQNILDSLGYQAIVAANGREAIDIYEKDAEKIDLIILDMIMPIMGGKEALFHLKKLNPDCKVLITSGFAKDDELEAIKTAGICGFLRKPFKVSELSRILANALAPKGAGDE